MHLSVALTIWLSSTDLKNKNKSKTKQNKDTYCELYVEFHYIRILEFSMHLEGNDQCDLG